MLSMKKKCNNSNFLKLKENKNISKVFYLKIN